MSNKGGRVSPDYLADIAPEYALMKLRRDQEVHWMNALRNLTEQFKYKHRLERCLGVIIMHPDDDRMIDVNWAYIERPWLFDPILERQLEYELGL